MVNYYMFNKKSLFIFNNLLYKNFDIEDLLDYKK